MSIEVLALGLCVLALVWACLGSSRRKRYGIDAEVIFRVLEILFRIALLMASGGKSGGSGGSSGFSGKGGSSGGGGSSGKW